MREIVHLQAGQCGNQIGAKVSAYFFLILYYRTMFSSELQQADGDDDLIKS